MMVHFKRLLVLSGCVSFFVLAGIYFLNSQSTPGGYSSWSEWSICSKTCGIGLQGKIRKCDSPTPGPLGKLCIGPNVITRRCKDAPCPVDGGVSDWSEWGKCNRRCGRGEKKRVRTCTNPSPLFGGKRCAEALEERIPCNTHPCPVDGRFSKWTTFSSCIVNDGVCGFGIKTRTRICNNPTPAYGGKHCDGAMSETHSCSVKCEGGNATRRDNVTRSVATNLTTNVSMQSSTKTSKYASPTLTGNNHTVSSKNSSVTS